MVWKSLQTEEVTQHPTAKEELLQQGTALPDEMNEAKEELLPQGTEMEDITGAPGYPRPSEHTMSPNSLHLLTS